jgi:hypothetical protein
MPSATEILTTGVIWTVALVLVFIWLEGVYDFITDKFKTER